MPNRWSGRDYSSKNLEPQKSRFTHALRMKSRRWPLQNWVRCVTLARQAKSQITSDKLIRNCHLDPEARHRTVPDPRTSPAHPLAAQGLALGSIVRSCDKRIKCGCGLLKPQWLVSVGLPSLLKPHRHPEAEHPGVLCPGCMASWSL